MRLSQFLEKFPLSRETQHWTEAWLAGIATLLGTFDFVLFIKAGGLCTSTETHLTPLPNVSLVLHWNCAADSAPTASWRAQRSRDSLSYRRRAQRQWASRCDLFHLSSTLSFAADVDTYGLILKVLHVLNLHICYRPDIWVILSVMQWHHYVISVIKLKQTTLNLNMSGL